MRLDDSTDLLQLNLQFIKCMYVYVYRTLLNIYTTLMNITKLVVNCFGRYI